MPLVMIRSHTWFLGNNWCFSQFSYQNNHSSTNCRNFYEIRLFPSLTAGPRDTNFSMALKFHLSVWKMDWNGFLTVYSMSRWEVILLNRILMQNAKKRIQIEIADRDIYHSWVMNVCVSMLIKCYDPTNSTNNYAPTSTTSTPPKHQSGK